MSSEDERAQDRRAADGADSGKRYVELFAKSFIEPHRRQRFEHLAVDRERFGNISRRGSKRIAEYGTMLSNLQYWIRGNDRVEWRQHLPGEELVRRLLSLGAPRNCYVLSQSREWDGRFVSLDEVVHALHGACMDTSLLICVSGSLAYYYHCELLDGSAVLRKIEG